MGSSDTAWRYLVERSATDLTRFGILVVDPSAGAVEEGRAATGVESVGLMLARLFALVRRGLEGARNCFRSLRLGELRDKRGLGGESGFGE